MRGWSVWVEKGGKNWRCRWKGAHGTGQEVLVYASDAKEFCDKKRRNFMRLDAGLSPLPDAPASIRLSEWSRRYLAERSKNPRKNTYIKDEEALGQFLEWSVGLGDTAIAAVTTAHIYSWKEWLYEEKKYADATVRMRLAHLKPAFGWAKARGWVAQDVAEGVKMPKPTKAGRVLTEEEIRKLYSIPPRHVVLALVLLLNSGMRKGEVVWLRKSQIEKVPEPGLWRVHFNEGQTKNGKPKAVVLLPAARQAVEESMSAATSERVFEKVTKDVFDYWMRLIQKAIGPVRLHDLKHTFCTYWMRATGDLYGLQQMTGNSLSSLRIYNHLALGTPRGLADFGASVPKLSPNSVSQ